MACAPSEDLNQPPSEDLNQPAHRGSLIRVFAVCMKKLHVLTYMPYLTLWDKISLNLAHLKVNSHKIFSISQNFQTILQHVLWRNKHKSHFVVFIASLLHFNKGFWLFWGIFIKISQNFIKSLKNVPYLTDFSPQLMARLSIATPRVLGKEWSECVDTQDDQSLCWAHMPFCRFHCAPAKM